MPRRCRDRNPGSLSRELLSAFSIRIVIPVQLDKIYRTRCARNYTRYPGVYAHIGAFFRYVTPARYFRARGAPNKEPGAEEQGVPGLDPLVLSLSLSLSLCLCLAEEDCASSDVSRSETENLEAQLEAQHRCLRLS